MSENRHMSRPRCLNASMKSPILFIVFNRPEQTRQVFEAIRRARPPKLYVVADGPRADRPGDVEMSEQTRRIATDVDWPCEVNTLFREANVGCRMSVSTGISWFFSQEPEGIILEDDCLPCASFFPFCEELLDRYRNVERVAMISGMNFCPTDEAAIESYRFSRFPHIWGWATWKRTWDHYDANLDAWPTLRRGDWLRSRMNVPSGSRRFWKSMFDLTHMNYFDTWDYALYFSVLKMNTLAVIPKQSLIHNIGFSPDATHTRSPDPRLTPEVADMDFPLVHPSDVVASPKHDIWVDLNIHRSSLWSRSWGAYLVNQILRLKNHLKNGRTHAY